MQIKNKIVGLSDWLDGTTWQRTEVRFGCLLSVRVRQQYCADWLDGTTWQRTEVRFDVSIVSTCTSTILC